MQHFAVQYKQSSCHSSMTRVVRPSWAKVNLCGCHDNEFRWYHKRSSKWFDWSLGGRKNCGEYQIRRPASKVRGKTMACDSTKWLQLWPRNVGNKSFVFNIFVYSSTQLFATTQYTYLYIYIMDNLIIFHSHSWNQHTSRQDVVGQYSIIIRACFIPITAMVVIT